MDYTGIYTRLIARARDRQYDGYTERHHIVPRSLGGPDTPDNLVRLTPKEHFVCHLCLVRTTHGREKAKMSLAAKRLIDSKHPAYAQVRVTGRIYAALRETIAVDARIRMSAVNKGVPKSEAWKAQQAERMRGNTFGRAHKGRKMTDESKRKLAETQRARLTKDGHPMKGRHHSEETRQKICDAKRGYKMKPEHVEAMRKRMTGQKRGPYRGVSVTCHPERAHFSNGLCNACYWKAWREKKKNAVES